MAHVTDDTALKIGLVVLGAVLGAVLKIILDATSSFITRWRKRRDFAEALKALLIQLREARKQRDWKSAVVRAHVDRVLEYFRTNEPSSLHRTARVRSELLDLYARLKWFTTLRLEPEAFVPKADWFQYQVPLQLSDLSHLSPMNRLDEARTYFALTALEALEVPPTRSEENLQLPALWR